MFKSSCAILGESATRRYFSLTPVTAAVICSCFSSSTVFAATVFDAESTAQNSQIVLNQAFDPIVVTATRAPQIITQIPARVETIDSTALTQSPITDLPHVLQQNSAINVVQSGGFGQQTSLFIRGSESDHTLVLKDGIRLNTASTGAANLQFMDTSDLERIEVLKGPASVLYGSDAIGGVVQLLSRTPTKNAAFFTVQGGQQNSFKAVLGGDMVYDALYGHIRAQRMTTDGSPVSNSTHPNNRAAGYSQSGVDAKLGIKQDNFDISVDYWGNQGNSEYYDFFANKILNQDFDQNGANLRAHFDLAPQLKLNARLSQFNDDIDQKNTADFVHSTVQQAELYGTWQFTPQQNILLGVTHQQLQGDILSYGSPYDEKVNTNGYFAQHQYQDQRWNSQIGVRLEDNQKFGRHTVGQAGLRYHINPATSVYGNVGSSFKAPTLNDLYGYGGNVDLKPETATSYELGIDYAFKPQTMIGASIFNTQVKNLITSICVSTCDGDYIKTFPVYQNNNVNKAKLQGGELYAKWQQAAWFVRSGYQYVKATDDVTDKELLRRPRHNFSLTGGWNGEQFGADISLAAKSTSKDFATPTPGYATVDLNGYWHVTPQVKLFANVENVADSLYKTANYSKGIYYINGGRLATVGATFKY